VKTLFLFLLVILAGYGCGGKTQVLQQDLLQLNRRVQTLEDRVSKNTEQLQKEQNLLAQHAKTLAKHEQSITSLEKQIALFKQNQSPVLGQNQTPLTSPCNTLSGEKRSPKLLYQRGLRLILAYQFKKGRDYLEKFIRQFPKDKLVPNALYWIGESYYSQGNYAQAILTFKQVVTRYPKSYKAAHALLKIAYAYAELKDLENARFYLKALLSDYPKSDVVAKARAKLRSLK